MLEISLLAEELLASQESFCFLQLVLTNLCLMRGVLYWQSLWTFFHVFRFIQNDVCSAFLDPVCLTFTLPTKSCFCPQIFCPIFYSHVYFILFELFFHPLTISFFQIFVVKRHEPNSCVAFQNAHVCLYQFFPYLLLIMF
jgi:hypothetical protein